MNNPRGLREANEKLYALRFPEQIPQTLVTSDMRRLKEFMVELGGEMIIKPLDGAGGSGVFYLNQQDRNTNSILEAATNNGQKLVMGQRYLPEIRQGDKRIIVLNGEPSGRSCEFPRKKKLAAIFTSADSVFGRRSRRETKKSAQRLHRCCGKMGYISSAWT